jgi:hypothetical protein
MPETRIKRMRVCQAGAPDPAVRHAPHPERVRQVLY